MTMPRDHQSHEELISASLAGDLTDDERQQLDAHLDGCARCRATLAAFSDQRRIMSGLRHVAPPRDLDARVRTGIERGAFAPLPWWRRPATLFAGAGGGLALVAGALLAIVLLGPSEPQVGEATPTPMTTDDAQSPAPTATPDFPVGPTPTATEPTPEPEPTEEPVVPTPTPEPPSPEPDLYLAWTGPFDNRALTIRHGPTGETIGEIDTPSGPPVAAELSPDGQWIAYITTVGERGTHEVRVTRIDTAVPGDDPDTPDPIDSPIEVGATVVLGESLSESPFLDRLAWSSPLGAWLAYTLADPESGDTDVHVFETATGEHGRATMTGNAHAASWIPDDSSGSSMLWVSVAEERPTSHLLFFSDEDDTIAARDPSEDSMATAEGVFQPLLSPNGRFAIYWDGAMERSGDSWIFDSAGQPYLAEHLVESETFGFSSARPVFSDLSVGRDGFTSASITWGPDSNAYAVWDARWTGPPQSGSDDDPYPDPARIYFGRATDERGMTRFHALDRDDIPEGRSVVDVKVSPTGEHLVISVRRPVGGVLEAPAADLLLVERNTGNEPDVVTEIRGADDGFWYGPAVFARSWGATADQP